MIRQKKPDSVQVNFVESIPGRRRGVKIKPVSYPLTYTPPVAAAMRSHSSSEGQEGLPPLEIEEQGVNSELPDLLGLPGSHRARKEKEAEAWAQVRSKITTAMICNQGFLNGGVCVFCKSSPISVWCRECGWNAYLCEDCATKLHAEINIFHLPLLWKVLVL